ncbi:Protein EFR3-like cmp44E [Papilio machaon]|uniref:Protein EFR3-like cmp44E n=1 Tax=Papilio machaon TaxID=76193 RepID=A0A0N1PJJ1_PAPMA|nr:Protein EFR3-like cmp44E [Papilio machaon]
MMPMRKVAHRACFIVSRTVYMTCCCGCCSALRPRYKRLVDNIFPASPQDGLVKSNMEKLTFYSLSSPEKLDRIGEYLFQKASRDIYRRRHGFVIIAMEAMDQLLLACHSQTLNLFVESFLKMVQKLLESTDPQLQILATQSFVRFANIEEDTPSYHRRYDFFVSKFSAMCHSNHGDKPIRDKIRLAGIQGLQGVIRKTVSDDLVENIWEAQHMDKIVPSLLYNMQVAEKYETVSCMETDGRDGAEEDPSRLAEACLRELVGRASFGHIRSVLRPVLTSAQYSYSVVEALMQHLDAGSGGGAARTRVRAARASVLSNIVAIAAADSVGPSVLEIINNLLTNLRASVARDSEKESEEKLYQEALINALGEFADHLPDYQKIDIMMFIVSKIPSGQRAGKPAKPDVMLQSILLKATSDDDLLSTTDHDGEFGSTDDLSTGSASLRSRLLHRQLSSDDPIMQSALNNPVLSTAQQCRLHAVALSLCALPAHVLVLPALKDYVSKQSALNNPVLSTAQQCRLHAVALSLCALPAHVLVLPALKDYVSKIIEARREEAPHLLPPLLEDYDNLSPSRMPSKMPYLMIDQMALCECVKASGIDGSRLQSPLPYSAGGAPGLAHRHSWVEAGAAQGRDSLADIAAGPAELDSANSSPGVTRHVQCDALDEEYRSFVEKYNRNPRTVMLKFGVYRTDNEFWNWGQDMDPNLYPHLNKDLSKLRTDNEFWNWGQDMDPNLYPHLNQDLSKLHTTQSDSVSLEALRRAANGPSEAEKREAERKKASLNNTFRTAPFDYLLHLTQPKYEIQDKLQEIFSSLSQEPLLAGGSPSAKLRRDHDHALPDLFLC